MSYTIELRPAARRQLRNLPVDVQQRLASHIDALAEHPRPPGVRRMTGRGGSYRIRIGDYRIVYMVDDAAVLVTIMVISHRSDVYR